MRKVKEEWVGFYHPNGKLLCEYTVEGTFASEARATRELLAAENEIKPCEIKISLQKKNMFCLEIKYGVFSDEKCSEHG